MNGLVPSTRPPITMWMAILLLSLALVHPVSAACAVWLLPVPVLLWTMNGRPALAIGTATLFGAAMWLGHLGWMAAFLAVAACAAGWVMGEAMRAERTPYPALIAGALVFAMAQLTGLAFLRWLGIDIFSWLGQAMANGVRMYLSLLSADPSASQWQSLLGDALGDLQSTGMDWLRATLAGWICVISVSAAMTCLSLARALWPQVLPRIGWLDGWRLPADIIPVYLIALTAVVFGWGQSWAPAWQAVNSIALLAEFLLWIQGLAALWRHLAGRPGRRAWWWAAAVLASIVPLVSTLCVLYGMLDCMREARSGS